MARITLSVLVFFAIIFLLVWLRLIWQADRIFVNSHSVSAVKELLLPKE